MGTNPSVGTRLAMLALAPLLGCAPSRNAAPQPTTQPAVIYDTAAPKPVENRDWLESLARDRGADLRLVDKLMDKKTEPPAFDRAGPSARPADARITRELRTLPDQDPFPEPVPLADKDVTVAVGIARSTFRTREREEVLSAVQPFIDLEQREVNVRGAPAIHERPDEIYHALLEGREQMAISHVFDYLLVRSWFEDVPDNATVLLGWAQPRSVHQSELLAGVPGVAGTSVLLVVAADSPLKAPADLKGARMALAANSTHGPGTFLAQILADAGHLPAQAFFGSVTLRRYAKDALIDLVKGKADVACVDEGTMAAVDGFYGLGRRLRIIAVSPRYNMDVLYTTQNNVATHRTEIELTQRQLTTLRRDPEGQEVLFFFDQHSWNNYREGDIEAARKHFEDFLRFFQETPADLKPLLDPNAPVDRRTYDRLGDE